MGLYGLEHSEVFWEKALDTKLLLAWNARTIVVAFRGTASVANALADLQARGPHHRMRTCGRLSSAVGSSSVRMSEHTSTASGEYKVDMVWQHPACESWHFVLETIGGGLAASVKSS